MAFLQDYQSLGVIGRGAFATIYKVKHLNLEYVRALKVLKDDVISEEDKAYKTFVKECRVLLKIGNGCHPNIVRIYQPRLVQNRAMVEMDYVNGCTVLDYLKEHHFMPIDEVMRMFKQIGGALAYCHYDIYQDLMSAEEDKLQRDPTDARRFLIDEAKRLELIDKYRVIHNDLHSNNVMRRNYDGNFVLLDFGLSIQDHHAVKSSSRQGGAPEYKSPEKWDNDRIETTQNDIYSFGVLMYEVMAGRVPFELDTETYASDELKALNTIRKQHCEQAPPPLEPLRRMAYEAAHPGGGATWQRDYPDWLEQMVMKCLAKTPEDRYADAREMMNDFNRHCANLPEPVESVLAVEPVDLAEPVEAIEVDVATVGTPIPAQFSEELEALRRDKIDLQQAVTDRAAKIADMQQTITALRQQLDEALAMSPSASLEDLQAANTRARQAELERNSLRSRVAELERIISSQPPVDTDSGGKNSVWRMVLILIVSTILGIALGAVFYNVIT